MAIAKRCTSEDEEDPWGAHSSMMSWATLILLALIFLIVLGVLIIWLTVRPRPLKYTVEDALVSNFNVTHRCLVSADFKIGMSAKNPNHRVSFTYHSMKVAVQSDTYTLASTDGPKLFHDKDNSSYFRVNLSSHNVMLHESTSSHLTDQVPMGVIKIDVTIDANVKFKARHWKQDHCAIRIFCPEVEAHFSPKKAFKQTKCDVEL